MPNGDHRMTSQLPKTHLGPYRLDAQLGSGGMGLVFRATDEKLHREVAIKLLHPHLLANQELKSRFHREARVHASLMHPNVVTLLALYEHDDDVALVMEMVHGSDLKKHLKQNPALPIKEILRIARAILAGLGAAHTAGMVHRDLKPANVLISDMGEIKLVDFGLAKPSGGDDDLTQSGTTVGSFRYMAPEQILHGDIDARTDLYAFGILLFQMLTGKPPFDGTADGGGEFQIMEQQVRAKPRPPIELNARIPLELSDLILKLLEKEPNNRPLSCKEVSQRLDDIEQSSLMHENDSSLIHANASVAGDKTHSHIDMHGILTAPWYEQALDKATDMSRSVVYMPVILGDAIASKCPPEFRLRDIWSHMGRSGKIGSSWAVVLVLMLISLMIFALMGSDAPENSRPTTPATQAPAEAAVKPVTTAAVQPGIEQKTEQAKDAYANPPHPEVMARPVAEPLKAAETVKKVVKKTKKEENLQPATYRLEHEVRRGDYSRASSNETHEFKGGSRVFFEELRDYRWKESMRNFKLGKSDLTFKAPIHPRMIVLRKASVGKLDFTDGFVRLYVQLEDGSWKKVFDRLNDDVDVAVTIQASELPELIKGVRIMLRTPEPITVGPIDVMAY